MRRAVLLVVALLLSLGACSLGDKGTVTVLAPWTGAEAAAFQQVLDRFTAKTGIKVELQGTRALDQVLTAGVQKGTPPDVAVLPSLGSLAAYVRQGAVVALTDQPAASHGSRWLQLERVKVGDRIARYSVAIKADLKSIIWYDPSQVPELHHNAAPSWAQLIDLTRSHPGAWCLGMSSTPVSGWPGTDWIEDLVLHRSGPKVYTDWAAGRLDWTSAPVKQAFTDWHDLALAGQQPAAALLTDFGDAGKRMFADPPGCYLHHQASFLAGDLVAQKLGTGADFVPFPGGSRTWEVSANLAAMFNGTSQAWKLMSFLATDEAQRIWPAAAHGTVFSVNRITDDKIYDNPVTRDIATTLTAEGDNKLCFDASDLMPSEMTGAFYRAVLEYIAAPGRLDEILAQLDQVKHAIPADRWLDVPC